MSRDLETVANEFCAQIEQGVVSLGLLAQEVDRLVETFASINLGPADWERRRAVKSARALKAALDRFNQDQARLSDRVRRVACTTRFPA